MATSHFLNPQAPKYIPVSHRFFLPFIFHPSHSLYIPPAPVYDHVYTATVPFPIQHHQPPHQYTQALPPRSVTAPPPRAAKGGEKYCRQRSGGKREKIGSKLLPRKLHTEVVQLKRDEEKTTIMIKNIPNKYTRELLINVLEKHCLLENQKDVGSSEELVVSAFDFIYLPMDFRTGVNKGYAFVNFTHPRAVWKFYDAFNGKRWELFESPKICEIVSAKLQGKTALVNHFMKSNFRCETDEFLPLYFSPARDGLSCSVKSSNVVGSFLGTNTTNRIHLSY